MQYFVPNKLVVADDAERLCDMSDGRVSQYKDQKTISTLIRKFDEKGCMDFYVFVMNERNNDTEKPLLVFSDYDGIRLVRNVNTKRKVRVLCKRYQKTAETSNKGNQITGGVIIGIVIGVTVFIVAVLYVIPYTRVSFFMN